MDGAYGALAALAPGSPTDLQALGDADSVAVDPHKWLYAPLEAGCVLVRDADRLRNAFSYHPAYYHFDDQVVNYFDYGPQNSRGFRALKVWLALRQVGRAGYMRMIADDILLAKHLHQILSDHPDFEAATQGLSITTFRYVPQDLRSQRGSAKVEAYLNQLNQTLLAALEKNGEAFLSNAFVGGTFLLRACIVNFHTSLADVEALPPLLSSLGRETDVTLRRDHLVSVLSEGLRPSDSPTRALGRRFAGSLRARGSLAAARSHLGTSVWFMRQLLVLSEGLRPSDSPTRALGRRFAGGMHPGHDRPFQRAGVGRPALRLSKWRMVFRTNA